MEALIDKYGVTTLDIQPINGNKFLPYYYDEKLLETAIENRKRKEEAKKQKQQQVSCWMKHSVVRI